MKRFFYGYKIAMILLIIAIFIIIYHSLTNHSPELSNGEEFYRFFGLNLAYLASFIFFNGTVFSGEYLKFGVRSPIISGEKVPTP